MNSFFNIKKGERAAECGAKRAKNKTSTPSLRGGGMGVGVKKLLQYFINKIPDFHNIFSGLKSCYVE